MQDMKSQDMKSQDKNTVLTEITLHYNEVSSFCCCYLLSEIHSPTYFACIIIHTWTTMKHSDRR